MSEDREPAVDGQANGAGQSEAGVGEDLGHRHGHGHRRDHGHRLEDGEPGGETDSGHGHGDEHKHEHKHGHVHGHAHGHPHNGPRHHAKTGGDPVASPDLSITAAVITISDRSSRGERDDVSGPVLVETLSNLGVDVPTYRIIPDDADSIAATLIEICDSNTIDLLITTGGTGLAPRDVTPETTATVIDKLIPGISEAIRMESMIITPHAMLSRGICGLRGTTLILNVPGSPKAAKESLEIAWPALPHACDMLHARRLDEHTPRVVPGRHAMESGS